MAFTQRVVRFASRHKIALIGLLLGALILQVTRSIQGSGDFTFQQSTSATGDSLESVVELGGERSAELILPKNYSTEVPTPLLINLHGYTGNGPVHSAYTHLQEVAFASGLAYIAPTGSEDNLGNTYWNATEACCDFNNSGVDDVAYLDELIEKSIAAANIDPARIYLFGHSNGHFMTYAYLCSGSKKIAAVAGLAGAMDPDAVRCKAGASNVLHIHGEKDATILYAGGALFGNPYTSVSRTMNQWAEINKCASPSDTSIDLLASIEGNDTVFTQFKCKEGALDLWSIPEGIHTPALDNAFAQRIIDWFKRYSR